MLVMVMRPFIVLWPQATTTLAATDRILHLRDLNIVVVSSHNKLMRPMVAKISFVMST